MLLKQHVELGSKLTAQITFTRQVDGRTLRLEQTDSGIIQVFVDHDEEKSTHPVTEYYSRDAKFAVESVTKLPWEQDCYGISPGWMRDGHELVCLSCAKTSHFENWGSIEMVDVTNTGRHECAESCGEWVGDKCSTAGCTNHHADDSSVCEHCDTHLVCYEFHHSSSYPYYDEESILELMYEYCSSFRGRWESLCPSFEQFCTVADVFESNGSIRFPEDFDIDEDHWNDWFFENT